jgi:hypothetical protein
MITSEQLDFANSNPKSNPERAVYLLPLFSERVKILAVEVIRQQMLLFSIRTEGLAPTPDTPFFIWDAIHDANCDTLLSSEEIKNLKQLIVEAGGWIIVTEETMPYVPIADWKQMFARWQENEKQYEIVYANQKPIK